MEKLAAQISTLDTADSLTLAVGWQSGRRMRLAQITIAERVASSFRNVVRSCVEELKSREPQEWTPDADLTPETFLVIASRELGESPVLVADHHGVSLHTALAQAEALPILDARKLPSANLSFYAIVLGPPGQRSVFLRRNNPQRGLRPGRIYTFLADTLERIEEPIFAFDDHVDLVFLQTSVCILSQAVFAAVFRSQDELAGRIPKWAADLNSAVPIANGGLRRLTERAKRDSRIRARLEAIVRRDHLSSVPPAKMRAAMVKSGLDPNTLLDSRGDLILEESDIPQVLYFLNEDLFTGSLSNTGFRADKKAIR